MYRYIYIYCPLYKCSQICDTLPENVQRSETLVQLIKQVFYRYAEHRNLPGGGGVGGHCLLEGKYPKQNYRPPVLCYCRPLSLTLMDYRPLFSRYQRTAYCYYCCYRGSPSVHIIFSGPDTIILITVAKTLIIANPGCFHWTSQATNYSPNRKCPSDSPPSESYWVCDIPLFSSLQLRLRESVLQWVPKTRVSAPTDVTF